MTIGIYSCNSVMCYIYIYIFIVLNKRKIFPTAFLAKDYPNNNTSNIVFLYIYLLRVSTVCNEYREPLTHE